MGNKRLKDDLLNVSVPVMQFGNGFKRSFAVGWGFTNADEQARRKGHLCPPSGGQGCQSSVGCLSRCPPMRRLPEQVLAGCFEHHPHRSTDRTQTAELFLGLITNVDVGQESLIKR
jgi:hypothetical protein